MHAQAAPVPGTAHTRNAKLLKWVADIAALTQPDAIYWCDGSQKEYDAMVKIMVDEKLIGRMSTERIAELADEIRGVTL